MFHVHFVNSSKLAFAVTEGVPSFEYLQIIWGTRRKEVKGPRVLRTSWSISAYTAEEAWRLAIGARIEQTLPLYELLRLMKEGHGRLMTPSYRVVAEEAIIRENRTKEPQCLRENRTVSWHPLCRSGKVPARTRRN